MQDEYDEGVAEACDELFSASDDDRLLHGDGEEFTRADRETGVDGADDPAFMPADEGYNDAIAAAFSGTAVLCSGTDCRHASDFVPRDEASPRGARPPEGDPDPPDVLE